jgi:hypothetical protein
VSEPGPHPVVSLLLCHVVVSEPGPHPVVSLLLCHVVVSEPGPHPVVSLLLCHVVVSEPGPHPVVSLLLCHVVVSEPGPRPVVSLLLLLPSLLRLQHLALTAGPLWLSAQLDYSLLCEGVNARAEFDRQVVAAHQVSTRCMEELGLLEMLVSLRLQAVMPARSSTTIMHLEPLPVSCAASQQSCHNQQGAASR